MRNLPADLSAPDRLSARIRAILDADLARKWRIGDVARRAAVSPRSLQRQLGAEGTTFSGLLTGARVDRAKVLLGTERLPVTNIGYLCGFADTAHFTRTFKAATGRTPTAWRADRAGSGAVPG